MTFLTKDIVKEIVCTYMLTQFSFLTFLKNIQFHKERKNEKYPDKCNVLVLKVSFEEGWDFREILNLAAESLWRYCTHIKFEIHFLP